MPQVQDTALWYFRTALSRTGGHLVDLEMEWLALQGFGQGDINSRWAVFYSAGNALPVNLKALISHPSLSKTSLVEPQTLVAIHIDSDIDTVGERDDIAAIPLWFATQDVFNIVGLTASAPDSSSVEYQNCIDAYEIDRPTIIRKVSGATNFKTAAELSALVIQGPVVDAPAAGFHIVSDPNYAVAHSCAQLMIANALEYGDPASSDPRDKLWIVVQGGYVNLAQAAYEAVQLGELPDFFDRVRIIGQPNYNSWWAPNAWNYLFTNSYQSAGVPGIFGNMWMIGHYYMGHALNRNNGGSDTTFWNTVTAGSEFGQHLLDTLTRPGGAFQTPHFRAGDAICWMWLYNAILQENFDPTNAANPAGPYQTHIGVNPWPSQTFGYSEVQGTPNPEGVTYSPTIWGPAITVTSGAVAETVVDLGTLNDGTDSWYGSVGRMMAYYQSGYTIVPDDATADEGQTVTFNITGAFGSETINVDLTGIQAADLVENTLSFSVVLTAGVGSFQVTLVNDLTTEGSEIITATIRDTPISTTVTVADTSASSAVPDPILELRMTDGSGETISDTSPNNFDGFRGISASNSTGDPDWVSGGLDFISADIALVPHHDEFNVQNLVLAVVAKTDILTGTHQLMAYWDSPGGDPPVFAFRHVATELQFLGRGAAPITVATVGLGITTGAYHL